jgi:hypothetical protein
MEVKYSPEGHSTQALMGNALGFEHWEWPVEMVKMSSVLPQLPRIVGVIKFDFDLGLPTWSIDELHLINELLKVWLSRSFRDNM